MTLDWSQHCFVGIGVMLEYNRVLLQYREHSVSSMQPNRLSNPGCQEYHTSLIRKKKFFSKAHNTHDAHNATSIIL